MNIHHAHLSNGGDGHSNDLSFNALVYNVNNDDNDIDNVALDQASNILSQNHQHQYINSNNNNNNNTNNTNNTNNSVYYNIVNNFNHHYFPTIGGMSKFSFSLY